MGRWQWLIVIAVLLGLLVAALVVGDAMVRIYQTLALLSPWLGRLVLLLFLALMLAILVAAGYYFWLFCGLSGDPPPQYQSSDRRRPGLIWGRCSVRWKVSRIGWLSRPWGQQRRICKPPWPGEI